MVRLSRAVVLVLGLVSSCAGVSGDASSGSGSVVSESVAYIDGDLDCLNADRWTLFADRVQGRAGAASAEEALVEAFGRLRGWSEVEFRMTSSDRASLVRDGREVVTSRASGAGVGYFVETITGCDPDRG